MLFSSSRIVPEFERSLACPSSSRNELILSILLSASVSARSKHRSSLLVHVSFFPLFTRSQRVVPSSFRQNKTEEKTPLAMKSCFGTSNSVTSSFSTPRRTSKGRQLSLIVISIQCYMYSFAGRIEDEECDTELTRIQHRHLSF